MVFCCEKCRFLFKRVTEVSSCPDCGSARIRYADAKEEAEFRERLAAASPHGPQHSHV